MFLIVVVPLYSPPFVLQLDQDFETSLQKPTRKKVSRDTRNSFESGSRTSPKVCALQNNFHDTEGDIHT